MKLVIVSGLSGSGKSIVQRTLEDLDFYCVDNLPITLINSLLTELKGGFDKIAISLDVRNLNSDIDNSIISFGNFPKDIEVTSIFLDANNDVLLKRYTESRRIHPLAAKESTLEGAIEYERELLQPLKQEADHIINTSESTIYELADKINQLINGQVAKELILNFTSFGFKYGQPKEADFMFDVRFLPNPHWEESLRPFTGRDEPVQKFLMQQQEVNKLEMQIYNFIDTWLPSLEKNNRSYLTVAIGCTGGKHRSVYMVEKLANRFKDSMHKVETHHRELNL
ncbi:RNase adapter RapZ [Paraferrimonas sp. SM1919]|uniref:RNase adapter RapZ n=1 Tax=Paraferrimonas sp. SM1919 TaxID=2662263 RepID=UPI0013D404BE|nr:RNase adapter RapZ [Paraferrimonas sp. SM1919]